MSDTTLQDLGERTIIDDILRPRYGSTATRFGDDCASVVIQSGGRLLITTDPCPLPMAEMLGHTDRYYRGWLLATINLSDLAAAGAAPLGLLTSLVLPSSTPVAEFLRLLDGVDDCCAEHHTAVLGGNLKEGTSIDVQATAFGLVPDVALSRFGARPDDLVTLIGPAGEFWAGVLATRAQCDLPDALQSRLMSTVLTPVPQLRFGQECLRSGLRAAVMDNSDGLGPALETLAVTNGVGFHLDLDSVRVSDEVAAASELLHLDPVRLLFGWGDWNLVACISPDTAADVRSLAAGVGAGFTVLGSVTDARSITVRRHGKRINLEAPDSQRFAADSWFTSGIDTYIDHLLSFPLP